VTHSRPVILQAASRRQATRGRGTAILAALKVANYNDEPDISPGQDVQLGPGGLPLALLNIILAAEGRSFFWVAMTMGMDTTRFFYDMLPVTAESAPGTIMSKGEYTTLPATNWTIRSDGNVHIPRGATMQKFRPGTPGHRKVNVSFPGGTVPYQAVCSPKRLVKDRYEFWRKQQLSTRTANEMEQLPTKIWVKFLPLGIRNWKDHKGFNKSQTPLVSGLILVTDKSTKKSSPLARWANCGRYGAYSYLSYKLDWKQGILVGNCY
jgi:hypothetical protein